MFFFLLQLEKVSNEPNANADSPNNNCFVFIGYKFNTIEFELLTFGFVEGLIEFKKKIKKMVNLIEIFIH